MKKRRKESCLFAPILTASSGMAYQMGPHTTPEGTCLLAGTDGALSSTQYGTCEAQHSPQLRPTMWTPDIERELSRGGIDTVPPSRDDCPTASYIYWKVRGLRWVLVASLTGASLVLLIYLIVQVSTSSSQFIIQLMGG